MTWRTAIGLKPTATDLAQELLEAANRHGLKGWEHDPSADAMRNGDHVINLANMHLEYAAAPRSGRRALVQKYFSMLQDSPVSKLWSLAQTKIYPLLRSRYDRVTVEIEGRRKPEPLPPRAGRPFIADLDQVLGYDHGNTISQVKAETLAEWGVTLEAAIDRSMANLRALPPQRWHQCAEHVWQLESPAGYTESLMQIPRIFADLPARGTPLVMIPNRGVLFATGSDEPNGVATLLTAAREAFQKAPWPLCGQLFRISSSGTQLFVPEGADAVALANIHQLDLHNVYAAQKTALEAHCEAVADDVFVATYSLRAQNNDPDQFKSVCAWTEGVPSLLPRTDLIALVWGPSGDRQIAILPWEDAAKLVGHYFKATDECPMRIRVDEFPSGAELAELQKRAT